MSLFLVTKLFKYHWKNCCQPFLLPFFRSLFVEVEKMHWLAQFCYVWENVANFYLTRADLSVAGSIPVPRQFPRTCSDIDA